MGHDPKRPQLDHAGLLASLAAQARAGASAEHTIAQDRLEKYGKRVFHLVCAGLVIGCLGAPLAHLLFAERALTAIVGAIGLVLLFSGISGGYSHYADLFIAAEIENGATPQKAHQRLMDAYSRAAD